MAAVGHYRFALHPDADASAFESLMSSTASERVLQLTRVTSGFDERLYEVVRPGDDDEEMRHPRAQYVWEVTVHLMGSSNHRYDFAGSADRVQAVVAHLATLVSVEALREVQPPENRSKGRAVRSEQIHADVAGVRFQTEAVKGSKEESVLQQIQEELAGGRFSIPSDVPVPHLYYVLQQEVGGGRGPTTIALWVPSDKQSQAEELLGAAGFTVEGS